MVKIHIIAVKTGNEPHAIRSAAEWWGAFVTMTWVGNSGQVVDYLSAQPDHDLIIFSSHGDEHGLLLPKLADEIIDRYPYNEVIRPEDFAQFLHLNGNAVINLSCMGGMQQLAEVFLANGAQYYIGPVDYPNGSAALMYVLDFLYNYIHKGQNVKESHCIASNHSDDRQQFSLYTLD
jgi:hypothetical protein